MPWRPFKLIVQVLTMVGLTLSSCQKSIDNVKINGISLEASRDSIQKQQVNYVAGTHANYIALIPYGYVPSMQQPELIFNLDRQWFGEREDGIRYTVEKLREKKLKIMIKPQLWIRHGKFTGDLKFETEEDWLKFEDAYTNYILLYAKLSEELEVELFCIGTELFNFASSRPTFWLHLISEVRKIYSGKLVYAENWDRYNEITFWKELDFIGVDAYFPLSDNKDPSLAEINEAWQPQLEIMKSLSQKFGKKIMFTEYGYRSIDFALRTPWNSATEHPGLNMSLQSNAYRALYQQAWSKDWFAGGFLWKWHQQLESGGTENPRFTPQNKPAEDVLRSFYGSLRNEPF